MDLRAAWEKEELSDSPPPPQSPALELPTRDMGNVGAYMRGDRAKDLTARVPNGSAGNGEGSRNSLAIDT